MEKKRRSKIIKDLRESFLRKSSLILFRNYGDEILRLGFERLPKSWKDPIMIEFLEYVICNTELSSNKDPLNENFLITERQILRFVIKNTKELSVYQVPFVYEDNWNEQILERNGNFIFSEYNLSNVGKIRFKRL